MFSVLSAGIYLSIPNDALHANQIYHALEVVFTSNWNLQCDTESL